LIRGEVTVPVLLTFKDCNPLDFIREMGYKADLLVDGGAGRFSLVLLDGSSESFMDVILTAIMDLAAERKTIADIKYTGKGARRWFSIIFPPVLAPIFFGILDRGTRMVGYLVATQSISSPARKGLGIALVKPCRGYGIGFHVFKHVQENLEKLFQPGINELVFETSRNNTPMMNIAHRLGFIEVPLPQDETWGMPPKDRARFLWVKP
jgi:RimJ/RimL family protein N-acetyltransferase